MDSTCKNTSSNSNILVCEIVVYFIQIILVGPPSSGKTNVAEFLSRTFNATNIDWTEIIRGASLWSDDVADELKQNLADLTPLTDETVKFLLKVSLTFTSIDDKYFTLLKFIK